MNRSQLIDFCKGEPWNAACEMEAWRAVAVALAAVIAENGYDPNSAAVRAYNHARNGRMAEALAVLE